jgi:hypothetical protein
MNVVNTLESTSFLWTQGLCRLRSVTLDKLVAAEIAHWTGLKYLLLVIKYTNFVSKPKSGQGNQLEGKSI